MGVALRARDARSPFRNPPQQLRPSAARCASAEDHAAAQFSPATTGPASTAARHQPDRRPRDPAIEGRAVELGEHRCVAARRATVARATAPAPGGMHPRPAPRRPTPRSSSTSPARRFRRPGAPTCPRWPEAVVSVEIARPGGARPLPPSAVGRRHAATRRRLLDHGAAPHTLATGPPAICSATLGARRPFGPEPGTAKGAHPGRPSNGLDRAMHADAGLGSARPAYRRDKVRRHARRWSGLDSAKRVQPVAPT